MHSASEACFGDIMPIESTVQGRLGHRSLLVAGGSTVLSPLPDSGLALSKSLRGCEWGHPARSRMFFCVWVLPVGPLEGVRWGYGALHWRRVLTVETVGSFSTERGQEGNEGVPAVRGRIEGRGGRKLRRNKSTEGTKADGGGAWPMTEWLLFLLAPYDGYVASKTTSMSEATGNRDTPRIMNGCSHQRPCLEFRSSPLGIVSPAIPLAR